MNRAPTLAADTLAIVTQFLVWGATRPSVSEWRYPRKEEDR